MSRDTEEKGLFWPEEGFCLSVAETILLFLRRPGLPTALYPAKVPTLLEGSSETQFRFFKVSAFSKAPEQHWMTSL